MSDMVNAFWECFNLPLTVNGITYNLYIVFLAGLILDVIGLFIGKVILFTLGKR